MTNICETTSPFLVKLPIDKNNLVLLTKYIVLKDSEKLGYTSRKKSKKTLKLISKIFGANSKIFCYNFNIL